MAAAAINAADSAVDFRQFNRIAIVFPVQSCSFAGLSNIGCSTQTSPSKGSFTASVSWLPIPASDVTTLKLDYLAHELGHALGLGHSSTDDYGTVPLGRLADPGITTEYGDIFSVMGYSGVSYNGQPIDGQYSAQHKSLILHWLAPSGYQEVQSSGTFTLAPFESSNGLRALRILRDAATGAWLWVEYRQPIGDVDSSLSLLQYYSGGTNVFNGPLIYYEDPALDALHTYLLDFNPVSSPNNFLNAAMTPGHSWSDPSSLLSLTVNSANTSGLPLTVNYDSPCATLQASSTVFASSGGAGTITVSAGSGCSWTASTAANWITFSGPTSGQGGGTVNFTISSNSGVQRNASITVQRQSIAIVQAGTGMSVLSVSPNSGVGNSGSFTFQFADASGYADISYVNLYFSDIGSSFNGDSIPECRLQVSPGGEYLWLARRRCRYAVAWTALRQPDGSEPFEQPVHHTFDGQLRCRLWQSIHCYAPSQLFTIVCGHTSHYGASLWQYK